MMNDPDALSPEEDYFVRLMVENPTRKHAEAGRLAFPDHDDPAQKAWQVLQKPKVMKKWLDSMKVWNRVLSVPKLLKNLEESLNATKIILKGDGSEIVWPDHMARNKAREQAFEILGILERNKILQLDQSQHTHIFYVWKNDNNPVLPATVSDGNSQLGETIPSGGDRAARREIGFCDQ
jgi:hypothetical protein